MGRSWQSRIDWRKRRGRGNGNTKTEEEVQSTDGNKPRRAGTPLHLQPADRGEAGQTL